jgi:hypothetical protein
MCDVAAEILRYNIAEEILWDVLCCYGDSMRNLAFLWKLYRMYDVSMEIMWDVYCFLWGFCKIFGVSMETGMFGVALEILWDDCGAIEVL